MRSRRTAWGAAVVFWTLFGLVTGLQVWISMITHGHSVPRLLAFYVAVWEAWVAISAAVFLLTRRWPIVPFRRRNVLLHLLCAIILGSAHIAWWVGLTAIVRPYDRMTPVFSIDDVPGHLFWRLPLEIMLYGAVAAVALAAEYYERMRQRELHSAQLETLLSQAQLRTLELQLQPHFLFNTLNAISSLTRNGQSREAVVMIAGLSDLLRYTLDHANQQRVPLAEEVEMLERYLEIQRTRFADRLMYEVELGDDVQQVAVPTLILQPLAENAVRHGIAMSAGAGTIRLRAFRDGHDLRVEMFNTGVLRGPLTRGIGLQNSDARLRQLYGEGRGIELRSDEGGVVASFAIPWTELA